MYGPNKDDDGVEGARCGRNGSEPYWEEFNIQKGSEGQQQQILGCLESLFVELCTSHADR